MLTNEFAQSIQTLEKNLTHMIAREIEDIVDTFRKSIQNAKLTAVDSIIISRTQLAIRPLNELPEDVVSVAEK